MAVPVEYAVQTQYGKISVLDSQGDGPAALLIHGNSACKEVFRKQFESNIGRDFRLIAIDLPGHGKSENARDAEATYSLPGYADVAIDVLQKMGIQKASIVGWSLGGHIAIDMLKRWPGTQGILITGTPPIPLTAEGFSQGFRPFPCLHLMSQEKFSPEEAETFVAQGGINTKEAPFLLEATLRTHGAARSCLIASMQKGIGGNQKEIVETSNKPVAVVGGEDDTGINNDYIQKEVAFKNLWNNRVNLLKGGHGVFWQNSQKFNEVLGRFLKDIDPLKEASPRKKETNYLLIGGICALAVAFLGAAFFKLRRST
jgi:pimeloyl-ACP methyl ester carboxylesterase